MTTPITATRRQFITTAAVTAGAAVATGAFPALPALASTAGDASTLPADTAHRWIAAMYDAVLAEGLTPPGAARVYAYTAIAMYEGAVPGMPSHRSLVGQLNGLPVLNRRDEDYDWPAVMSGAAHAVTMGLFAGGLESTRQALSTLHADIVTGRIAAGVPRGVANQSAKEGDRIGEKLLRWIDRDRWRRIQGRGYTPPPGPSMWVPTPPNFGMAIEPYWGDVRPMVLHTADEVIPPDPIPFDTTPGSAFHDQALAIYEIAQSRTQEQIDIARFWTDNPRLSGLPSGHWLLIVSQTTQQLGLALDGALEAYARTAIALHDAFTNCWVWKYRFNLLRPVTYIQRHIDPDFVTLVNSPQFPEYTSGHSVASGAAATVLTALLGAFPFVDDSHAPRSMASRSFESFWDAANEAAISRLYGNIHYPMGIDFGVPQGEEVGTLINQRLITRL